MKFRKNELIGDEAAPFFLRIVLLYDSIPCTMSDGYYEEAHVIV